MEQRVLRKEKNHHCERFSQDKVARNWQIWTSFIGAISMILSNIEKLRFCVCFEDARKKAAKGIGHR